MPCLPAALTPHDASQELTPLMRELREVDDVAREMLARLSKVLEASRQLASLAELRAAVSAAERATDNNKRKRGAR